VKIIGGTNESTARKGEKERKKERKKYGVVYSIYC
jgi:hypothetical protein